MDVLVQTKFQLPPHQPHLVLRQPLLDRLHAAADRRIILISAPAGFGKSTLIASWAHQLEREVAWLALDALDDEPLHFWQYVTAALATVVPAIEEQSAAWFREPSAALGRSLPGLLVNALVAHAHDLTLILDDYHFITDREIHTGVDFLVGHLPAQSQLVLISRHDPPLSLPRLRARNQLCEIRAADLRFALAESSQFLRERMGLQLDEAAVKLLEERTEGWVAGLQFTGLSLQTLPDVQAMRQFITELSGRDRHIVDYLMTEVFAQQPPDLQQFLLHTAILDRLSAPLCNAVLGHDNAQETLDHLERANLFVVALDNERHWYRYHHLFAELLRARLRQVLPVPERAALHMRAHDWYLSAGMLDAAVDHALLAGEPEHAVALLAPQVYADGRWNDSAFLHVRRWVDQLPDEYLREHPRLAYAALEANLLTYRAERVEHYLHLLNTVPELPDDVTALVMAIQANFLRIQAKNSEAKALLREAMAIAPEEALYAQLSVKMQMAVLLCEAEDVQEGIGLLYEASQLAEAIGQRYTGLFANGFLVLLTIGQGKLHLAHRRIEEALAKTQQQQSEITVTASLLYIGLSILYYEWNDLARAEEYCNRALAESELAELGDLLWHGYQVQAYLALQHNDLAQLEQLMDKAERLLQRIRVAPITADLQRFYDTFVADIALRLGDWERVAQWVQRYPLQVDEPDVVKLYLHEQLARIVLAQAQQPAAPHIDGVPTQEELPQMLEPLLVQVERRGMGRTVIQLRNLLAQSYWLLGATDQAFAHLHQTLTAAQPEGYIRSFLDDGEPMQQMLQAYRHQPTNTVAQCVPPLDLLPYLDQLLTAFAQETVSISLPPSPSAQTASAETTSAETTSAETTSPEGDPNQALIEPLTDRELEVLQEIINGLTNQEIADRLVISIGTVKRHISNIYGKLEVRHRTEAVARAQELQLVD